MFSAKSQWLGNQIKKYVASNIPSWGNMTNNPFSSSSGASVPVVYQKPPNETNFIFVQNENVIGFIVQESGFVNPFTVKRLYQE